MKEATARIKVNKLLESAGWRFFADGKAPAHMCLELNVKIKEGERYREDEVKTHTFPLVMIGDACTVNRLKSQLADFKPDTRVSLCSDG